VPRGHPRCRSGHVYAESLRLVAGKKYGKRPGIRIIFVVDGTREHGGDSEESDAEDRR